MNETSFLSARVDLLGNNTGSSGFWDNPKGNPTPPPSESDTPPRQREAGLSKYLQRQAAVENPSQILTYTTPIHYPVTKTGFYCVGELFISAQIKSVLEIFSTSCGTRYRPFLIKTSLQR